MNDFCPKCNITVSFSNKFCTNCGNELPIPQNSQDICNNCNVPLNPNNSFCTNCGKKHGYLITPNTAGRNTEFVQRSKGWYLLPIFFGIVGGLISYWALREVDKKTGKNCLIIGIILSAILIVLWGGAVNTGIMTDLFSNVDGASEPGIYDRLDGLSNQMKSIKLTQIMDCENNIGYLQSIEMGDMIRDRCINSVMKGVP